MITPIPLLQSVRVASPCDASWEGMEAIDGERVRFCLGCSKNVYNLSAMTQAEAEGLLRQHEGRLCVRYYQRRDGTVLTGDCPVGVHAVRMGLMRRSVAAAGLFAMFFGAMAAVNQSERSRAIGDVQAPVIIKDTTVPPIAEPTPEPELRATVGKVAMPTPMMGALAAPPHDSGKWEQGDSGTQLSTLVKPVLVSPQEKDSTDEAILKPH